MPNRKVRISIDRLKPAYILQHSSKEPQSVSKSLLDKIEDKEISDKSEIALSKRNISFSNSDKFVPRTTRSGRVTKLPSRYL